MVTAWEKIPWMMEGGVKHSVNIARLLAYVGFGGREGIIGNRDLAVRETVPASPKIRVFPGACAITNDSPNAKYEAYAARLPVTDEVTISATGSGAGRCDLIVAQIKNPYVDTAWPTPTATEIQNETAEFVGTGIISLGIRSTHPSSAEVLAACAGKSCLPLASIVIPANTATITQSMIQSHREVVSFRESREMEVVPITTTVILNSAAYKNIVSVPVKIPDWATHYSARGILTGGYFGPPQSGGYTRLLLTSGATNLGGNPTGFIAEDGGGAITRITTMCGDKLTPIPANLRGTSATMFLQGNKVLNSNLTVDTAATASIDYAFKSLAEQPEGF